MLHRYLLVGSVLMIALASATRGLAADASVVHTSLGDASGAVSDGIRSFKGLPYAQPPVGELRWKPPIAATPWSGTRDASRFGADCVQKPRPDSRAPAMSEDCLTLNIWTPVSAQRLPVMVWVYGGGFVDGSASLPIYDGTNLAKHDVIVVSLNYRTGVFGFLAHRGLAAESPQQSAGNYGLLDTIEALRWVKTNIAAFGGDPARVTVFGESAGASMLDLLLVSPLAKGLIDQAILESPGAMRLLSTLDQAETIADVVGPDIAALRAMPADQVLALNDKIVPPVRRLTSPRALGPIIDGWVVPRTDTDALAKGDIQSVPLIVGGNSDEGRLFTKDWPIRTASDARAYAEQNFGGKAPAMLSLYGLETDAAVPAGISYAFGDTQFNYGVRGLARGMSAIQPKVWRYLFTRAPAGEQAAPTHSEEIDYVFGNLGAHRFVARGEMNTDDRRLSETMTRAWAQFAHTGDPNAEGLPSWPKFTPQTDEYLEFGDEVRTARGYRSQYLDFVAGFLAGQSAAPRP
jgi:carboxylesterase type B